MPPPHLPPESHDPYDRSGRRQRRTAIVTIAAIVAVLAAGGGAYAIGEAVRQDPREVVVAYMEALQAGDVEAANALAFAEPASAIPAPESMDDATPLTSFEVAEGYPASLRNLADEVIDGMWFDLTFVVDGQTFEGSVMTESQGGWWATERWSIREGLAMEVRVTTPPSVLSIEARFAGATTTVTTPSVVTPAPATAVVYPGVYALEPVSTPMLEATAMPEVVVGEATWITLEAAPGEQASAFAESTAIDGIAPCVEVADDDYLSCDGLTAFSDAPYEADVAWALVGEPTATAGADTWMFDVATTLVATYVDDAGATVEQRFPIEAAVFVFDVTPDGAQASIGWWERG
ncbi:hypothetical protein [Agrococcus jejuensis]|uniref:hypothetical protein n=1 Tax=Agrococcus jejuensis TaxID=399736 RepID=UPI0012FB8F0E|nr:hypothetical protein [Agrococcus jejuensis]